ncbi:MAG TPA: hypothetical protein PKA53_06605, partial [Sphingobacterium sp.]|nr:hypothetical protein [Sphingobacterium sp.]
MKLFRIGLNKLNVLLMIVFCMGCDKEDNTSFSLEDGKSTVVYDLAGDPKASISDGIDGKEQRDFYTFLFRFQDKKQIWIRTKADSTQWLKTDQWDIAFTGQYNSNIYINNAQNVGNPGYEGPSDNTAIILVNQPYEQVSTAPLDSEFDNSTIKMVGWADASAPHGWFNYSTTTHIMKA